MAPRVLMLHTGGTLGMSGRRPTPLKPDTYSEALLQHVPELRTLANIDVRILFNLDSSNVTPRDWVSIAQELAQEHHNYDGFVVIHGTDTMAYTASACAFLLEGLKRPVIFTGSQRPLGETRSDARANLVGAVELATQDIPEVGIFFNSSLFRAVRAVKSSVWTYDAFESPNCEALAQVGVDLVINPLVRRPTGAFRFQGGVEPHVACMELHPGLDAGLLDALVDAGAKGLVLRAFGAGNVPIAPGAALVPSIARAVNKGIPVVLTSQVPRGGTDLSLYECGTMARDAGALDGGDLTTPAAVVKLMYALHQGGLDAAKRLFAQDLRGEGGVHAPRVG